MKRVGALVAALAVVGLISGCGNGAREDQAQSLRAILRSSSSYVECLAGAPAGGVCGESEDTQQLVAVVSASDGRRIAIQDGAGDVSVWDVPARRRLFTSPPIPRAADPEPTAWLSSDGSTLARITTVAWNRAELQVWSVLGPGPGRRPIAQFLGDIDSVGFDPAGRDLLIDPAPFATFTDLVEWDLARRRAVSTAPVPHTRLGAMAASAVGYDAELGEFVIASNGALGYIEWKPGTAAVATDAQCDSAGILSPDATAFACVAGPADLLSVWSLSGHHPVGSWPTSMTSSWQFGDIAFVAGGDLIAAVVGLKSARGTAQQIRVYRVRDHTVVTTYSLPDAPYDGATRLWAVGRSLIADEVVRVQPAHGPPDVEFHRVFVFST